MIERVPLKTSGMVGGNPSEKSQVRPPPIATPMRRHNDDLDHCRPTDDAIRGADGFQNANLWNLLQDLDLEKSADDQHANQKGEEPLRLDGPLLSGVTGNVVDRGGNVCHFDVRDIRKQACFDSIDL